MHRRIFITLEHPQARPRCRARLRLHRQCVRRSGHTWSEHRLLHTGGHHSLVPRSDSPWQHCLDPRLLVGWDAPSPPPPSANRVPHCRWPSIRAVLLAKWSKAWVPMIKQVGRCLGHRQLLRWYGSGPSNARHRRAASPLRPAWWPGQRLRLPGRSHAGVVPRWALGPLLEAIAVLVAVA